MHVLLIRHGQTNYNELDLCNSDPQVDVHLTEKGIMQAHKLAEELKNADFEHIFVSELHRTRQTADIINRLHAAPITVDSRLNDNRSGYEGKPKSEYIEALDSAPDRWTARLDDGESLADVQGRVADFITYLYTTDYQSIAIVTSEVIVQAFYRIINHLSYEQAQGFDIDNCACVLLDI